MQAALRIGELSELHGWQIERQVGAWAGQVTATAPLCWVKGEVERGEEGVGEGGEERREWRREHEAATTSIHQEGRGWKQTRKRDRDREIEIERERERERDGWM